MEDKELRQHCLDWLDWCRTRRFYTVPAPRNMLARLQTPSSGREPNARNDAEMQFFNMAIHTLVDLGENEGEYACFYFCYIEGRRGVKREAERLKISRATYYNRVNAFTRRALSMARSLKTAHGAMNSAQMQMEPALD